MLLDFNINFFEVGGKSAGVEGKVTDLCFFLFGWSATKVANRLLSSVWQNEQFVTLYWKYWVLSIVLFQIVWILNGFVLFPLEITLNGLQEQLTGQNSLQQQVLVLSTR